MRRLLYPLVLLLLLLLPAAASAQDNQLLWDLTQDFTVTDLGFSFKYPAGWVYDTSNGIRIAENKADLAAVVDEDSATNPEGFTITVVGAPLEALNIPSNTKLDKIVDSVVKIAGITEQERFELPVMTYRSISIAGTNTNDRPGIGTIWVQSEVVVVLSLSVPELTGDAAFSWGVLISTLHPTDTLPLSAEPLPMSADNFTIAYPADWFVDPQRPDFALELESDLENTSAIPKGMALGVLQQPIDVFGEKIEDVKALADATVDLLKWDETLPRSEHMILGQPAVVLRGHLIDNPEEFGYVTVFMLDDKGVIILTLFPSEEAFNAFAPTQIALLQSIKAPETS